MAFHGDLVSFPLPELLQWIDGSRKTGTLQLVSDAGSRRLFLKTGQVVASASLGHWERIARLLEIGQLASGQSVLGALAVMAKSGDMVTPFKERNIVPGLVSELAREELYSAIADITIAQRGEFHWSEDSDTAGEEWTPIDLSVRHLLFESLRWVDEHKDVERTLPLDTMLVRATVKPNADMPALFQVILHACANGQSMGRLRLALGLSRSAVQRRVYELLRSKKVEVDGAPQVTQDPIAEMLEIGAALVRQRQFDAAALVFSTLLHSDPADRRVREFARMVEREHVAALYRELPPILVPELIEDPEGLARLRPEERQVAALINGRWDVSAIVLASQNRELDTLKALSKLVNMGLLRARDEQAPAE